MIDRTELNEIKDNRAKQKVGSSPLEGRLITALEEAWAEAEAAKDVLGDAARDVAYQRRHRKWALKKAKYWTLRDSGVRLTKMRARAEQAEAERDRLRVQLDASRAGAREAGQRAGKAEAEAAALRARVERAWLIAKELMHYPWCMKKEQGPCICGLGQLRATLRPEEESDG